MDRKELPVKLYYRIGEVAGLVGVEPHVLRYWESEFSSIRPQKSRRGQRIYSRRDVERLLTVKELLYGQGFTIAGARKRLREGVIPAEPEPSAAASPEVAERLKTALHGLREELLAHLAALETDGRRIG